MILKTRYFLLLVFMLISTLGFSQECNIIYVSPNGSGSGTQAAPTSFLNGLALVSPGVDHIRMASGTYDISNTINLIGGVTIEGGFDAVTWVKSNNAATLIHRDNTNVTAAPDRIVAISAVGLTNFQLHDLSILVDDAGGSGVTTYGIHIDGCSNYSLSRVRSSAGNGSNGIDGLAGVDGVDGVDGVQGQNGNNCGGGNTAGGAGGSSWNPRLRDRQRRSRRRHRPHPVWFLPPHHAHFRGQYKQGQSHRQHHRDRDEHCGWRRLPVRSHRRQFCERLLLCRRHRQRHRLAEIRLWLRVGVGY